MIATAFRQQIANPLNINGVRLLNEYVTAPLGQASNPIKWSGSRFWKIEAKSRNVVQPNSRPRVEFDPLAYVGFFQTDLNELLIKTQSMSAWSGIADITTHGLASQNIAFTGCFPDIERQVYWPSEPTKTYDDALAEFEVTFWENLSSSLDFSDSKIQRLGLPIPGSPLQNIRAELQVWLDASVDDLAILLDLSPTTLVNATKAGHTARPKTIRKMMVVHGLLRELQRVLGIHAALTWARTAGRRLLETGQLSEFEQYVSTHIFPEPRQVAAHLRSVGNQDAELDLIPQQPIGRPSRI